MKILSVVTWTNLSSLLFAASGEIEQPLEYLVGGKVKTKDKKEEKKSIKAESRKRSIVCVKETQKLVQNCFERLQVQFNEAFFL